MLTYKKNNWDNSQSVNIARFIYKKEYITRLILKTKKREDLNEKLNQLTEKTLQSI